MMPQFYVIRHHFSGVWFGYLTASTEQLAVEGIWLRAVRCRQFNGPSDCSQLALGGPTGRVTGGVFTGTCSVFLPANGLVEMIAVPAENLAQLKAATSWAE